MGTSGNIIVGYASISLCGVDVGYTEEGVSLRKEIQYEAVENDHYDGIKRLHILNTRFFLTTTLLEATLANMWRALQEPEANLSGATLSLGGEDAVISEFALSISGKGVSGARRTYTFYRATPAEGAIEHIIGRRTGASVLPFSFELFRDIDNDYKIGTCVEA